MWVGGWLGGCAVRWVSAWVCECACGCAIQWVEDRICYQNLSNSERQFRAASHGSSDQLALAWLGKNSKHQKHIKTIKNFQINQPPETISNIQTFNKHAPTTCKTIRNIQTFKKTFVNLKKGTRSPTHSPTPYHTSCPLASICAKHFNLHFHHFYRTSSLPASIRTKHFTLHLHDPYHTSCLSASICVKHFNLHCHHPYRTSGLSASICTKHCILHLHEGAA